MNPGKLRRRISFLEWIEDVRDGIAISEWEIVKKVYASVETENGRGFFAASADLHANKAVFRCRYFRGLDRSWRVQFSEKIYRIEDAVDENGAGKYYLLFCEEVPNGS